MSPTSEVTRIVIFMNVSTDNNPNAVDAPALPPFTAATFIIPSEKNENQMMVDLDGADSEGYCSNTIYQEKVMERYATKLANDENVFDNQLDLAEDRNRNTAVPAPSTCSCQGCKRLQGELKMCHRNDCYRMVHVFCFNLIREKYNLFGLGDDCVACTKLCYTKSVKEVYISKKEVNGVQNLLWEKDGKHGEHDPENSMATLINWWNIHPNYQKYRGKHNNGVKKIQICEKICANINKVSRCVRTASSASTALGLL